jgi:hypothetical protein
MAAGQGFKTFTTGEVLTAGDVNGYLMQGINVFTNATARDAAITAPAEGQFAFTKDNNSLWYYDGAAWVASGATGDIEGVTAGVGISGGGTSGTVTVTNSMATAIDAKGDLVPGTGADTFARLAVGANGTILTADSAEATGLKWAAAASGSTFVGAAATRTSGTQTINHATSTAVTLPTESYDTDAFHDTSSNTSRLTIPSGKAGKYHFEMIATFNVFVTQSLYLAIYKNGSAVAEGLSSGYTNITFNSTTMISGSVDLDASVADYFEMYIYQESSGSSKDLSRARFSCSYLGA